VGAEVVEATTVVRGRLVVVVVRGVLVVVATADVSATVVVVELVSGKPGIPPVSSVNT
jgi:hypothetical protein